MQVDSEYLQGLGVGLQGLRASGQFCDAMVCVGSTRILVHKVVLSAASKSLHDLALDFDMMPHRERDQLEIVIPPDISLYAVNMFINFIYTGQLELNSRIVSHMERLGTLFGISRLLTQCREFIQRSTTPDSQNLNLHTVSQIEADSSLAERRLSGTPDASSHHSELSRSNSACSGVSTDIGPGLSSASIKHEPAHLVNFESSPVRPAPVGRRLIPPSPQRVPSSPSQAGKSSPSMSMLEKLMSPVVNLKKLPANITPNVVVLVSDNESEGTEDYEGNDLNGNEPRDEVDSMPKPAHQFTLAEKESMAIEAKRYGSAQVAKAHNIPLADVLSWMTLFGFRAPSQDRSEKRGKHVDHESDLALVRWIVQQQDKSGYVDLDSMKRYAFTVHTNTNPKFCASKTWLGNFLQRNMSVLQGIKFVHSDSRTAIDVYDNTDTDHVVVKQEVLSGIGPQDVLDGAVLEDIPLSEQSMVNDAILAGLGGNDDDDGEGDDDDNDDSALNPSFSASFDATSSGLDTPISNGPITQGHITTPFGTRPIIVGQSKSLDAKSERKIVQWVLERNARDGFVFTDDFKNFARSLYKGDKPFGATQCWMKKFLRRNRALKDVKFCSKFKNTYTSEEKSLAVTLAKRFGVGYAAKQTGFNHKVIHHWRLQADKGFLNLEPVQNLNLSPFDHQASETTSSPLLNSEDLPSTATSNVMSSSSGLVASAVPLGLADKGPSSKSQTAMYGIVPEFENEIVKQIWELQEKEGSVNYSDISRISQTIYKETRQSFKASYNWVKTFLSRHAEALKGIDLENVSKVLIEHEPTPPPVPLSSDRISEMVDMALEAIGTQDSSSSLQTAPGPSSEAKKTAKPIVVGPSVTFDRKTEKKLVEWVLEKQQRDGYVFTDDFKVFAKSLHTGPKLFSASSGWMALFQRRHRILNHVKWKSKFKSVYSEEEKRAAVLGAKRLGTGHVARQLGIDSSLLCAWRIKMDKTAPKNQTFWKGTKLKKFGGKFQPKYHPVASASANEACRGVVPEFEKKIIEMIHEEHQKEGSISYEEMSSIAQSVYKVTRPTFKASYAWIRNFMKRHEQDLSGLNIDNVSKVLYEEDQQNPNMADNSSVGVSNLLSAKRPIIVGQCRSLDVKSEKKLVHWVLEQQAINGYVFLDQFKKFAKSLYKGEKKFAATRAWHLKFMRRNHAALKHVKFTSRFRNQYSYSEKKLIVKEARRFGVAHVAKETGIDHHLINQWRLKLERAGDIPVDESPSVSTEPSMLKQALTVGGISPSLKARPVQSGVGPGLMSARGVVPVLEQKICRMINNKMDEEGIVTYAQVSMIARVVYKETRPTFKASYNWVKSFIQRNKKKLRHVEFDSAGKSKVGGEIDMEILIPDDDIDMFTYLDQPSEAQSFESQGHNDVHQTTIDAHNAPSTAVDPEIVIDNPEDPDYNVLTSHMPDATGNLAKIGKRPIIIGKARHFSRKEEKKIVDWLLAKQEQEGFVYSDDLRRYAMTLYVGEPGKFSASKGWVEKFMRRNRLENKVQFQSRLVGNNPKMEEKIVDLILEQQAKEGSVSNDDIQKITMSVYKDIRPNFRACYNWIKGFIKRHKERLAGVDLENVKKVYIPDQTGVDGVLIQNYDPTSMQFLNTSGEASLNSSRVSKDTMAESSWMDMDNSMESHSPASFPSTSTPASQSNSSILKQIANQKRPIIVAPPKVFDTKTEKKLVQWMKEQQEQNGCVYIDLMKTYAKSIHTGSKPFAATQAWMTRFKIRNSEALKNIIIKSRFRNEYSMEEKVAIVEEAKRLGCQHVGRKLGINGSVINSWKVLMENAEKMGDSAELGVNESFESKELEPMRGVIPKFERTIVNMVLETQRAKGSVSDDDIGLSARSVYRETRPNFKASNNWILDFIRKYKDDFKDVKFENRKKILTEDEKLRILSEEKKYGTEHVVKKRKISSSTLSHWRRHFREKSVPIPKFKAVVSSKIKKKYAKQQQTAYSMEEKRKFVAVAEENGITRASLKLGISRNMLAKWIRYFRDQGEDIVINFTSSSTLKKELEQKIVAWVLEQSEAVGIVLTQGIQEFAKKLFEDSFTNYNATTYWLETFLSANRSKFQHVRFRDKGDRDFDFTDEVKLKVCRYADKHGVNTTADVTGLLPKHVYHWRRSLKAKGLDISADSQVTSMKQEERESSSEEPKSLMQQKLDKIAAKFDVKARRDIVSEASIHGTSVIASKHKIPLPLMLKWMKLYLNADDGASSVTSEDTGSQERFKVKLPSVEKMAAAVKHVRLSKEMKRQAMEEAKKHGVKQAAESVGVSYSSLYAWLKEERSSSVESTRNSMERSTSSVRSSLDKEPPVTPISVADIKKEPGTVPASPVVNATPTYSNTSTPRRRTLSNESRSSSSSYLYSGYTESPTALARVVRSYTEEEKISAARTALEIGPRQAAIDLDIPLSNIKRWSDKYKSRITRSPKKPLLKVPPKQTTSATNPPTNQMMSGSLFAAIAKKRKAEEPLRDAMLQTKRSKYTDEERIEFVKLSESIGTREAAVRAQVSLDVLYKWRSKYMPGIRLAAAAAEDAADDGDDNDDAEMNVGAPEVDIETDIGMPMPRNMKYLASKFGANPRAAGDSITGIDSSGEDTIDESLVQVEGKFQGGDDDSNFPITNKTHLAALQMDSMMASATMMPSRGNEMSSAANILEISPEGTQASVHAFDDNDILVADQILELMDAETDGASNGKNDGFKRHGVEGQSIGGHKVQGHNDSVDGVKRNSGSVQEEAGDGRESREGSTGANLAMIKIVNVTSEAAPT